MRKNFSVATANRSVKRSQLSRSNPGKLRTTTDLTFPKTGGSESGDDTDHTEDEVVDCPIADFNITECMEVVITVGVAAAFTIIPINVQ